MSLAAYSSETNKFMILDAFAKIFFSEMKLRTVQHLICWKQMRVFLLLRPEFFSFFFSYLNLVAPVRFK